VNDLLHMEGSMFERVWLVIRDDRFVASVVIPRFNPPADVLLWGERWFVFRDEDANKLRTYREGMMWPVLPQEQYKGLDP
jgi:hypothetical protein